MKLKFLTSVASQSYDYSPTDGLVEVVDEEARKFIRQGVAVEVAPPVCPHCGADLEAAPEAAALTGAGERATLPGARKRG